MSYGEDYLVDLMVRDAGEDYEYDALNSSLEELYLQLEKETDNELLDRVNNIINQENDKNVPDKIIGIFNWCKKHNTITDKQRYCLLMFVLSNHS